LLPSVSTAAPQARPPPPPSLSRIHKKTLSPSLVTLSPSVDHFSPTISSPSPHHPRRPVPASSGRAQHAPKLLKPRPSLPSIRSVPQGLHLCPYHPRPLLLLLRALQLSPPADGLRPLRAGGL
uniref:Uncharacterized protein n=1 Tax=Aegilops tauschii subsp. strangulata TaxID=200361 RepID=A0A453D8V4_AEGTS